MGKKKKKFKKRLGNRILVVDNKVPPVHMIEQCHKLSYDSFKKSYRKRNLLNQEDSE